MIEDPEGFLENEIEDQPGKDMRLIRASEIQPQRDDLTDDQLDAIIDQGLAFQRDLEEKTVWVNDTLSVEPTPRGEWVVADHSGEFKVVPVGNAFFKTREEAWEFANR